MNDWLVFAVILLFIIILFSSTAIHRSGKKKDRRIVEQTDFSEQRKLSDPKEAEAKFLGWQHRR